MRLKELELQFDKFEDLLDYLPDSGGDVVRHGRSTVFERPPEDAPVWPKQRRVCSGSARDR